MSDVPYTPSNRFSVINPALLGRMQVLETISSDAIIANRMAKFRQLWASYDPPNAAQYDVDSLEFDPIKIQAELSAFFEMLLRDRVNQAARAVTLVNAIGTDLEAIASRYPGGVPKLPGESDDKYRNRIWLSPNPLSAHGVGGSYEFFSLTALQGALRDATATCIAGTPNITITLMLDGTAVDLVRDSTGNPVPDAQGFWQLTPFPDPNPTDQQVLTALAYCSEKDRKGLTDVLAVQKPKIIETDYKIRFWLLPTWDWVSVRNAVMAALALLIEGNRWLGASHTKLMIEGACAQPGVFDIAIDSPTDNLIADLHHIVRVNSVQLSFVGFAGP